MTNWTTKRNGMAKRKKLTKVERLLKEQREHPSPTCHDPRQSDIFSHATRIGFERLDKKIADILKRDE